MRVLYFRAVAQDGADATSGTQASSPLSEDNGSTWGYGPEHPASGGTRHCKILNCGFPREESTHEHVG